MTDKQINHLQQLRLKTLSYILSLDNNDLYQSFVTKWYESLSVNEKPSTKYMTFENLRSELPALADQATSQSDKRKYRLAHQALESYIAKDKELIQLIKTFEQLFFG